MREDWIETKLDDIAKWGSGGTPKSTIPEYYDGDIPWLIIGDLNDSYVSTSEKKITELGLKNSSAKWVKADSVLIAMYGSIGKLGINKIPVTTNQAIAFTQTLYGNIQNKFLFYYLLLCRPKLHKVGKGGTQKNISQTVLKTIDFPLAPLLEQKAIVAKIEQLFSELDNAVANLKTAKAKLKIYRQAVLKKAFEGELTCEWREKQTNLPTADELLEQIKKEREVHYKQQLEEWKQAVKDGIKQTKPKKQKELNIELNKITLGSLIEEVKYGTSKKCDYGIDGTGVLRIPNIADGYIDNTDLKFAKFSNEEITQYKLKTGDILIIRSNGSVKLVGKPALINENDTKYLYAGYLIRLRPYQTILNSKYLYYQLISHELRKQIEEKAKSTSGVNNINSGEIESLLLSIQSLKEQSQIVQEIESRLSVCDKIEETIETSLVKSEALRQSILKKAFEGKLLSKQELENIKNHPEYESAEELLKRIQKERSK